MEHTRISHYEVVRRIGRGGMGEVHEAVDLDLGRRVALKFIAPELAAEPEAFRRFEREARSAAALSHPHIATLFAFEREGDRPFLAMELMSGESLRDRLRGGPLPVATALALVRDVASGLAHAHRRGIVHRDIKPENLMFDLEGALKITDFGLAYAAQAARLTMTGTSLGTAAYMAPESVRGQAEAPADVFALGIVLHEAIGGALPFAGDSPLALMYTIANEPPRPLRALRPDTPEAVEALALRMLDKDPAARPDAAAVAREIAALTGAAPEPEDPAGDYVPVQPGAVGRASGLAETQVMTRPAANATEEHVAERVPHQELVARDRARGRGGSDARWRAVWVIPAVLGMLMGAYWTVRPKSRSSSPERHEEAVILNNRGRTLLRSANRDTLRLAQAEFQRALRRDPGYPEPLLNLGALYLTLGNPDSAAGAFGRVLALPAAPPESRARAHYGMADVDMAGEAWAGAVSHLREALRLDSSSPDALSYFNNLGFALVQAAQPDSARDVLSRGLERFPGNPNLQKNLALAEFKLGHLQAALASVEVALAADPSLASARELKGRIQAAMAQR